MYLHPTTRSMISTIWNSRPVISPGCSQGNHVTWDRRDTCCQQQEMLASPSSRWYMWTHLDVTFLLPNLPIPVSARWWEAWSVQFEVAVLWLVHAAAKVIMWLTTAVIPVVSGRIYLPVHPVAGTCNHVYMSRFCCPIRLSQFHRGTTVTQQLAVTRTCVTITDSNFRADNCCS